MKKFILSLIGVIAIFLAVVGSSIYLTDYNKIYKDFVSSAKIDVKDINQVNYRIKQFPSPSLIIDEVKQEGKIELKNINIRFSLLSVLSFSHKVSDIEIGQAIIHLSNDDVNYIDHDEFIGELIKKEALTMSARIDKLIFVESDKDIPFTIENFVFSGNKKGAEFTGEIASIGSVKGNFINNASQINFNLDVTNPEHSLKLQEIYENSVLKSGKMELVTGSLVTKFLALLPDFANLSDKLSFNQKIKITLDILPVNNWLNLKNIIIQSDSIAGTGEIAFSKNNQDINNVQINFSKLDLGNLSKNNGPDKPSVNLYSSSNKNKFSLNKNQLRANISAKQIIFSPKNLVTDVNLDFFIQNGEGKVEDFSGTFDQGGGFKIKGVISENSFRSLFNGVIALTHKDLNDLIEILGGAELRSESYIPYSLVSNVQLSSVEISMQDLLLKTNDTEISGFFSTKFIGDSPRINADLKIAKVNLDEKNFPAFNHLCNYAIELSQDSKKEDYLSKFIPLRTINSISNYNISVDQLVAKGSLYKNVNFNLNLLPGKIKLENLSLNDGKNHIDATIELVTSALKPSFEMTIHGGTIEVDFLSPRAISELRQYILANYALDKVDLNMNFMLDKLYQGDFSLDRVIFKAKNNKALFEINKFDADIFGGRMSSSGSILLDPYTINFVYALNSAIIPEISKFMPAGVLDSGGVISANGMWSTNGNSLEEQLYNLYTKSDILAKNITINNFSIDNLIQAVSSPNYNLKSFKDDLKEAILTEKTEISELKAAVELVKGLFTLKDIGFKTKYTAAAASASFNLYNLDIDLISVFSFYLSQPAPGRSYTDSTPAKIALKATGNLFAPKKEADTKELEDLLSAIVAAKKN
jgi:hypothetical protein